jgi:hypothetical protein
VKDLEKEWKDLTWRIPAHKVRKVLQRCASGVDFTGCSKGLMLESWVGEHRHRIDRALFRKLIVQVERETPEKRRERKEQREIERAVDRICNMLFYYGEELDTPDMEVLVARTRSLPNAAKIGQRLVQKLSEQCREASVVAANASQRLAETQEHLAIARTLVELLDD